MNRKWKLLWMTIASVILLLCACGDTSENMETESETAIIEQQTTQITSDTMIADVDLDEILKGNPISYECIAIDGWVFEWVVSDYQDTDRTFWEDGVLIVSTEGTPEPVQIVNVESEGGSGDLGGIENKFVYTDVNFDETPDLLICTGRHGAQESISYYCFLQLDGVFVEVLNFTDVANPSIDEENKLVLSQWRNTAVSHSWAEYKLENGEFVLVRELREDVIIERDEAGNVTNTIWYWSVNDVVVMRDDEASAEEIEEFLYGESSDWKLDDDRWNTIYNDGRMADYSIYL